MLRRAPHSPKRMTRPMYHLVAALLLADGERVTTLGLARGLYPHAVTPNTIHRRVMAIRSLGIRVIETCWVAGIWHGYRLTELPSDEHLDAMLACVPAVRRSAWWSERASRTRTAASPPSWWPSDEPGRASLETPGGPARLHALHVPAVLVGGDPSDVLALLKPAVGLRQLREDLL
jgi:hypothetical protein